MRSVVQLKQMIGAKTAEALGHSEARSAADRANRACLKEIEALKEELIRALDHDQPPHDSFPPQDAFPPPAPATSKDKNPRKRRRAMKPANPPAESIYIPPPEEIPL